MQFVRYEHAGETHWGYLAGQEVGSVSGDIYGDFVRHRRRVPLAEVKLLAPVLPGKIIGVADNFSDRLREAGRPNPEKPVLYLRPPSCVIGPGEVVRLPPQSQEVELGAELAAVIGRRARWVTPEEAPACILGYTCAADVTAVDLLRADGAWARAKSFDTFCPLGPSVTTGLNPAELLITCRVNGENKQMSSTHDLLFTLPQLVAYISSVMTLLPGDVILAGTPAGAPRLAAGDHVEIEIENLGTLRCTAQPEQRP